MKSLCYLILFVFAATFSQGQIKLPRLISDNAVFQRDIKIPMFGWSSPNENIVVELNGKRYLTKASIEGKWNLELPPQKAGGPFDLTLKGKNTIVLRNILFGDVWVCSGQSNMEMTMERVKYKYPKDIAASKNGFIRHFEVPDRYNFKKPNEDLEGGQWQECNPQNVLKFSAVGYFFAHEIYQKQKVPIGLINAALGGSPAEAWMSEDALKLFPHHLQEATRFRNDKLIDSIETADRNRSQGWYKELASRDDGIKMKWTSSSIDDTTWDTLHVPGFWKEDVHGVVWFTRTFDLDKETFTRMPGTLTLGRIVDQDSVFINGKFVGTTSYQYPPRIYHIPVGALKLGKNRITVKVINNSGKGGFVTDKPYVLTVENDSINLSGVWKYKVGAEMDPLPSQTFIRWKPLGLYNGMIAPLTKYPIKGVIWYQGESNTAKPEEYEKLFSAMIEDWRTGWDSNFPFLFVQLANFMESKKEPAESNWAMLREAQRQTSMNIRNVGMAVTIDLGEWNDIHPLNKKDVATRLALQARKIAYGENKLVASGPEPIGVTFLNGHVIIRFKNAQGLHSKGSSPLNHFAIASSNGKFLWAEARIDGDKVIVSHPDVTKPAVVRYAWADNPDAANLYNKEGLPATPFELRKLN